MILLDLFSGVGGFHLGLEQAGFEFEKVYFSEVDKYAISVYEHQFKEAIGVGSVTDVSEITADVITFGSPCQDFSLAGKRAGMAGERSSLISHAIRIIAESKPKFFIWENVKGTFSSNDGADFWAIIKAFADIGGYRLEWQLLNTSWWLPQNRERIYLVGTLGNTSGREIFPVRENDQWVDEGNSQPPRVRALSAGGNSGGLHSNMTLLRWQNKKDGIIEADKCNTLKSQMFKGGARQMPMVKIIEPTKKGYAEAGEGDSINFSQPSSKTRRGRVGVGVAQTLDTACNQGVVAWSKPGRENGRVEHRIKTDEFNTLSTGEGCGNQSTKNFVSKESRIRRLTPVECERLQGFPDNWTKYGINGEISDTQRYKMMGNAVSVPVVKAVGKQIRKALYD